MTDLGAAVGPVVIEFPAEFDIGNAGTIAEQLRSAITPEAGIVVADLTTTVICDSSGIRILVLARDWAATDNVELRLAVPPGPTLVVLTLVGLDQVLPIYPSLAEALAGGSVAGPGRDAPGGLTAPVDAEMA